MVSSMHGPLNHQYPLTRRLGVPQRRSGHISLVKPTRCTISQIYFIVEQHSTCFRRSLCPSSGV